MRVRERGEGGCRDGDREKIYDEDEMIKTEEDVRAGVWTTNFFAGLLSRLIRCAFSEAGTR